MCLGIPGKVVEIRDDGPLRMGRVDFGGVRKEACLAYLPEVELGDYVIVHVGFAISRLDEEEALRTLDLLRMLEPEGVDQELGAMAEVEPEAAGEVQAGEVLAGEVQAGEARAAETLVGPPEAAR